MCFYMVLKVRNTPNIACFEAQAIVQTNVHYVSSHSIFLKVIHRNSKDFIKG